MTTHHRLEAHVFVCTNDRPEGHPRGSCKAKGSEEVLRAFKAELLQQGLIDTVRAQKAGCLDQCEKGCAVVIYPDEVWYGGVQPSDVKEIVEEHLKKHKPVDRLRF